MALRKNSGPEPGQLGLFEPDVPDERDLRDLRDRPDISDERDLPDTAHGSDLLTVSTIGQGRGGATVAQREREIDPVHDGRESGPTSATAPWAEDEPSGMARRRGASKRSRSSSQRASIAPRVPPGPNVTLDQTIPDFVTFLTSLGRSQHTLKSFELDLRLLRSQLGDRAVGSIETGHLRQFIAWVRVSRENSPNSLRRKVATLKNFFGYLRDTGYLTASPADALPYPEAQVPLPEYLTDDAALRLVEVAEDNPFWYALVVLMLDTGLKRDEVLGLRVADVHLDDASPTKSSLEVRETDAAKRLRSRKIPVSERLRDALQAYYASQRQRGRDGEPGKETRGSERVFDVSIRGVNFIVEVCGQRAGIVTSKPRLTPQVLRETFAVAQMRSRMAEEQRCRERGWNHEALQLLSLRHDAEVLELLGLKEDPDTARKYRVLAKG